MKVPVGAVAAIEGHYVSVNERLDNLIEAAVIVARTSREAGVDSEAVVACLIYGQLSMAAPDINTLNTLLACALTRLSTVESENVT